MQLVKKRSHQQRCNSSRIVILAALDVQLNKTSYLRKLETMGQTQTSQAYRTEDEPPDCDLGIFLIGKTGHGKSATGNTILGQKKFTMSDMAESATRFTAVGWTKRDGLILKVVDAPGLLDTRLRVQKQLDTMEKNLFAGFIHCQNGFDAFVLVLSYGIRFTDEEQITVRLLRGLLRNDFIKHHSILAFTHGDSFVLNNPNKNFKDWCREQTGGLRDLMKECSDRVVLFHNLTPEKGQESTKELIQLARGLSARYTVTMFKSVAEKRSKFIERHKAIQLKGNIQSKLNMIIGCLENEEEGQYLEDLVNELENEIDKETLNQNTQSDIRRGIQQTRDKQYAHALETFQKIELEGKRLLVQFLETVVVVVRDFLMPVLQLVRDIYGN